MQPIIRTLLVTLCLFSLVSSLGSCSIPPPLVERIKASGEIIIATRNSGTTLYEGSEGLTGFEYELVQLFAKELGVKAHFIIPQHFDDLLPTVINGDAHLAAAGLTVTPEREAEIRFGPSYQEITQQVVYRVGNKRPRKIEDLIGKDLHVLAARHLANLLAEGAHVVATGEAVVRLLVDTDDAGLLEGGAPLGAPRAEEGVVALGDGELEEQLGDATPEAQDVQGRALLAGHLQAN